MNHDSNELDRILQGLILKNGPARQLRILQEECGECITAVSHILDLKRTGAVDELIHRSADLIISLRAIQLILGESPIDAAVDAKLKRMEKYL